MKAESFQFFFSNFYKLLMHGMAQMIICSFRRLYRDSFSIFRGSDKSVSAFIWMSKSVNCILTENRWTRKFLTLRPISEHTCASARWAHMHHFVCLLLDQNSYWTKSRWTAIPTNSTLFSEGCSFFLKRHRMREPGSDGNLNVMSFCLSSGNVRGKTTTKYKSWKHLHKRTP